MSSIDQPWQPTANFQALAQRAECCRQIRQFFEARQVLEIDVPVLARASVTDPNLTAIQARANNLDAYLQTSPEYFMKRLLAAGSGALFYLGKAFRDHEYGRRHHPEFTMLEWYRVGFNDRDLMRETLALLAVLLPDFTATETTYRRLFETKFGINPHKVGVAELKTLAEQHCAAQFDDAQANTWLDLLFSHCIEPELSGLVVVADFPASQGALAKVERNSDGDWVARRFEIYADGLELANGYWELTDAAELRQRFLSDQALRRSRGQWVPEIDQALLAAQESGLPDCAGIAMGVDRVLMRRLGVEDIGATMAFTPFAD